LIKSKKLLFLWAGPRARRLQPMCPIPPPPLPPPLLARHGGCARLFSPLLGHCQPSTAPLVAAPVPLLLLHLAPNPTPYRTPPDPFFLSYHRGFKGSRSPSRHPFSFSPSPPFPLQVKLITAHYTPPHCLLSKSGHRSIPEVIDRHCPPTVEVLALTSHSNRPSVPLSRRRGPHWLPSPPQPQADASELSSGWMPVSPSAPTVPSWRRSSGESLHRLPFPAPPPCHTGTRTATHSTTHREAGR
jgi:hypothetical protein